MNVRLIDVDQQASVMQGICQHALEPFKKLGSFVRVPFIQELMCFFPGKNPLLEHFTNRLTAAVDAKLQLDPDD